MRPRSRIFFAAVLDDGLIKERRPGCASGGTAIVLGRISRHLLQSLLQQRAVSQRFGPCIYLLLLSLGLFLLAFSSLPITLDIVTLGRHVVWYWLAVEFKDEDQGSKDGMQEES